MIELWGGDKKMATDVKKMEKIFGKYVKPEKKRKKKFLLKRKKR